jgi:hypothetical protein
MTNAPYDSNLELRALSAGAITSTGASSVLALTGNYAGPFKAVVDVTAVDRATGDEAYVLSVEVDTASGMVSPVVVATLPAITAAGRYEIPLSAELIEQHKPSATHIRVKAALGGTTPSLTWGARLAPMH